MNHRLKKFFRRFLLTNRRKNFIFSSLLPKPPENPACETRHKNSRNAARPPLPAKAAKAQNRKRKVQQCPASPLPADERQSKKNQSSFSERIRQNSLPLNKAFIFNMSTGSGSLTKRMSEFGYSFRKELQVLMRNVFVSSFSLQTKSSRFSLVFLSTHVLQKNALKTITYSYSPTRHSSTLPLLSSKATEQLSCAKIERLVVIHIKTADNIFLILARF